MQGAARVERRSAALLLRLAEARSWLQESLQIELPPGDLPSLLEDGGLLVALADKAMPGTAAALVAASPRDKIEAFSTACRQLGVHPEELLHPDSLLAGPMRSAAVVAGALTAFAAAASARNLVPPLRS